MIVITNKIGLVNVSLSFRGIGGENKHPGGDPACRFSPLLPRFYGSLLRYVCGH
jgi:hypothetical protein